MVIPPFWDGGETSLPSVIGGSGPQSTDEGKEGDGLL